MVVPDIVDEADIVSELEASTPVLAAKRIKKTEQCDRQNHSLYPGLSNRWQSDTHQSGNRILEIQSHGLHSAS